MHLTFIPKPKPLWACYLRNMSPFFVSSVRFPWNLSTRQCRRKWEIKLPGLLSLLFICCVKDWEITPFLRGKGRIWSSISWGAKNITWRGKVGLLTPALGDENPHICCEWGPSSIMCERNLGPYTATKNSLKCFLKGNKCRSHYIY